MTRYWLCETFRTSREYREPLSQLKLRPRRAVGLAVQSNLAVIITLGAQIDLLEKRLQERVGERPDYVLLSSVPGIGRILATIILLETGPIDRFAAVGNFASYARCVDSQHTSNGKKKGEGNTKNGKKYLSWAFVEAANFALRFCPEAKRFYERKKAKTNTGASMLPHFEGAQTL